MKGDQLDFLRLAALGAYRDIDGLSKAIEVHMNIKDDQYEVYSIPIQEKNENNNHYATPVKELLGTDPERAYHISRNENDPINKKAVKTLIKNDRYKAFRIFEKEGDSESLDRAIAAISKEDRIPIEKLKEIIYSK